MSAATSSSSNVSSTSSGESGCHGAADRNGALTPAPNLGIFDCSGVSDGSAAAIICRAEDAHRYTDKPLYVKALAFTAGPGPLIRPTTTPPSAR